MYNATASDIIKSNVQAVMSKLVVMRGRTKLNYGVLDFGLETDYACT